MATERIAHILLQHVSEHICDQKKKKNPKFEKKGFKKKKEKLSAHSHIKTRLFYGNKIKQVSPQAKFSK